MISFFLLLLLFSAEHSDRSLRVAMSSLPAVNVSEHATVDMSPCDYIRGGTGHEHVVETFVVLTGIQTHNLSMLSAESTTRQRHPPAWIPKFFSLTW